MPTFLFFFLALCLLLELVFKATDTLNRLDKCEIRT